VPHILDRLAAFGYAPQPIPAPIQKKGEKPTVAPPSAQEAAVPAPVDVKARADAVLLYAAGRDAFFSSQDHASAQAVRWFGQAVERDPQNPVYRYYLGLTLYREGRYQEALEQVLSGIRLESPGQRRLSQDALQRVQGPLRVWLENIRRSA
jgi:hypothetical protein